MQLPFLIDEVLALLILGGTVLLLLIWVIRLEWRLSQLTKGKAGRSLEESIIELMRSEREFQAFKSEIENYLKEVERRLKRSIQRIETIRFNPFKGTGDGGNQSFSAAFLNEEGDGVIISSLHARERVSIFSKQLKEFTSSHSLSDEERHVIDEAKKKLRE
ncbi:MAG: DUF4446 family protein [Candidatus Paceibacterota bacterium]